MNSGSSTPESRYSEEVFCKGTINFRATATCIRRKIKVSSHYIVIVYMGQAINRRKFSEYNTQKIHFSGVDHQKVLNKYLKTK